MPLHVQTLKDTFLRGTDRKEMEKNLSNGAMLKKNLKKRRKTKKIALLYSSDSVQNICFTVNMLCVNSDFTELSWL